MQCLPPASTSVRLPALHSYTFPEETHLPFSCKVQEYCSLSPLAELHGNPLSSQQLCPLALGIRKAGWLLQEDFSMELGLYPRQQHSYLYTCLDTQTSPYNKWRLWSCQEKLSRKSKVNNQTWYKHSGRVTAQQL